MDYIKRKDEVIEMFNLCRTTVRSIASEAGLNYQLTRHILNGRTANPKSDDIDALYHVLVKRMHSNG